MLSTEQINEPHRLDWSDRWPIRKIERHMHRWQTITKYLDAPAQALSSDREELHGATENCIV